MSSFFKVKDENGNWVSPETKKMIDQNYDPASENAQSGVAVAQAMATKQDKFAEIEGEAGASLPTMTIPKGIFIQSAAEGNTMLLFMPVEFLKDVKQNGSPLATQDYVSGLVGDIETALSQYFDLT